MVIRQFVFQRHVWLAVFSTVMFSGSAWSQVGAIAPTPTEAKDNVLGFCGGDSFPQVKPSVGVMPMARLPKKRTPSSETAKQVAEMLDTEVELNEIDSSISDFAKFLSNEGVPTLLDQRGLKIASQTSDLKLKGSFAKAPLRTALRQLLQPHNLRAIVDDDGLLITADFEQLTLAGIGITQSVTSDPKVHNGLLDKLQQKVSVKFLGTPLNEAVQSLGEQISATILLDRLALEEIGMTPDTPVKVELKSISLKSVLRLMLRELTLTYMVQDEVIHITTIESAEQNLVNQIHFLESTGFNLQSNAMQVIETTIVPDTWEALGGPSTMAPLFAGPYQRPAVLISTTTDIHTKISELLQALRATHSN